MRVHFVVHEAFEAPGACLTWAEERGYETAFSRVYEGDGLPAGAEGIDLLIVMGGPQNPGTATEECPHFDAQAEQRLVRRCVDAGSAVVGICLGSQPVGEALDGSFEPSPEKEIGAFPIVLTEAGRRSPKFRHIGAVDGHWHSDMPGLTPAATIIAWSEGCPRQIVEHTPLVCGFQCHMELTPEMVELPIVSSDLASLAGHRSVQQPGALRANNCTGMNALLVEFLDRLVAERAG